MKKSLNLPTVVLSIAFFLMSHVAFASDVDALYEGIEFDMPRVQEPVIPNNVVSITDFGAKNGGTVPCSQAFENAIDALSKKGGGKLIVPAGTWLTGPITLKSNIEIHAESGALVVFSADKSLYPLVATDFEGYPTYRCMSPINGRDLENIAFTGKGIFDGSGGAWRPVKKSKLTESQWQKLIASGGVVRADGNVWQPSQQAMDGAKISEMNVPRHFKTIEEFEAIKDFLRPVMVSLISCKKVLIDGPTFQNSPAWNIHPLMCEDFTMRNTTVRNPHYSQNGDGIDLDSCKNSIIHDCSFDVGDDAICIKSGKNKPGRDREFPTENLIVKNCVVYHGHGGVTVGSEMSSGVRNMHVSNCTFIGTDVGLRFKSTRGRGGVVENIYISDVRMMNIPTKAISFNLFYSGRSASEELAIGKDGKPPALLPVTEETPQFKNISIRDVTCNGARTAILLQGLPELKLDNVLLENIEMQADYGLICSDASNVTVKNLKLSTTHLPVVELKNSTELSFDGLVAESSATDGALIEVAGYRTGKTVLKKADVDSGPIEEQLLIVEDVPEGVVELL